MSEGKRLGKEAIESIRKDFEGSREWARVGALLAHISEVETDLENARKERDEARASATRGWEVGDAFHVQAGSARLKPSGQVAEAVERVRDGLASVTGGKSRTTYEEGMAALNSLSALAQGYEAAVADREQMLADWREYKAANDADVAAWKAERDAAVADNAALFRALLGAKLAKAWPEADDWVTSVLIVPHLGAALLEELETLRGVQAQAQVDAKFIHEALGWAGEWPNSLPAPSRAVVALLEQHRKALVRARNEGLEKAAAHMDRIKRIWAAERLGERAEQAAEAIRAMKKPEQ